MRERGVGGENGVPKIVNDERCVEVGQNIEPQRSRRTRMEKVSGPRTFSKTDWVVENITLHWRGQEMCGICR